MKSARIRNAVRLNIRFPSPPPPLPRMGEGRFAAIPLVYPLSRLREKAGERAKFRWKSLCEQPCPYTHGFTLIELVVVMAIIGLLLTIAVPRYMHSIDRGKVQVQQQNLAVMRDAIDKYYGDNGQYPETLDVLVTRHYLRSVPEDPVTGENKWAVIASPDDTKPGVYDVAPVSGTQLAAGEPASSAK